MSMFGIITWELAKGFGVSLALFSLTLILALPLGLLLMFALKSECKILRKASETLILLIRGTPLMLQLLIVFFSPGLLFGRVIFAQNRFLAALITFGMNYAGYFAVIYKGGYEAVSSGQTEAGLVLGLSRGKIFRYVLFPQIFKNILAPMSNEVITLVKDTSLVRVIAVAEIIKVAERYTSQGLIWPLFYTGIFYLLFTTLLSKFFKSLEDHLAYFETA